MEALGIFEEVSNYNLSQYITDFVAFVKEDQQRIADYYNFDSNSVPTSSFLKLDSLKKERDKVQILIQENKSRFIRSDFWELVENLDDISIKLDTISNYSKYYKSSISKSGSSNNVEMTYILRQNQTLESLSNEIGYSNPDDDWVNLSISNNMREEDYDLQGGHIFKFTFQNDYRIQLKSVIDNITVDNLYGKDLDKKLSFVDNDLNTLSPKDTIYQAVNILIGLIKGDVPEFPNDGIDKQLISKLNKSFNVFPSLFRQIYNVFSKDDTIKAITLNDIKIIEDSVRMEIQIETRLSELITQHI